MYIELATRMLLEELPDFQPQVELRDVYKFKETEMHLPDKEDELERIRKQKAFNSNILQHIKVESSFREEKDDDDDMEIAKSAVNAKKDFMICGEPNTDGEDLLGKSGDEKGEAKKD